MSAFARTLCLVVFAESVLCGCNNTNTIREQIRLQEAAHQQLQHYGMEPTYWLASRPGVWFDTGFGALAPATQDMPVRRWFGPRGHLHVWHGGNAAMRLELSGGVENTTLYPNLMLSVYVDRQLLTYQRITHGRFELKEDVPLGWQLSEGIHDIEVCVSVSDAPEQRNVAYLTNLRWEAH